MAIQVVILAAGQGKRMHSHLPKVLHPVGGKAMLEHVIAIAQQVSPDVMPIVIYGHQGEILKRALAHHQLLWVEQKEQAGTGHAVLQALPHIQAEDQVLVLSGDVPLIGFETLKQLIAITPSDALGMLAMELGNPKGYGRIKRNAKKQITQIIEEKDATDKERAINEINPGIYLAPARLLKKWLPKITNQNAQQEYYLTDIIAQAVSEKIPVYDAQPTVPEEIQGINDRVQLAALERFYQRQAAEKLMRRGVTLSDPLRLDVRGEVEVGRDVTIDINVILEGKVVIGDDCVIGPNVILRNVELGNRVEVKANSILEGANIGSECIIGPFARLRPGAVLAAQAHVGNFVEIKNSEIGEGTKINHLSYVGDSQIGKKVNVGAGTITCNYDGAHKHKTVIHDNVHIGSDTQLIAPVTIGEGATIAAGSTVIKDVPPRGLTLTHRIEQRSKKEWVRPEKK